MPFGLLKTSFANGRKLKKQQLILADIPAFLQGWSEFQQQSYRSPIAGNRVPLVWQAILRLPALLEGTKVLQLRMS